jgi:flagellar protein FlaG
MTIQNMRNIHGGIFMRVISMDAVNIAKNRDSLSNIQENIQEQRKTNKLDIIRQKNISQMNEFELNELPVSERIVIEAIERANNAIVGSNRKFEFTIHESTKEIMIKVLDSETNEIIREIPPEEILDMVAKIWEMVGIIVDERR